MLNCNIADSLFNQIKKSEFGLCYNPDTLISMAQKQLIYELGCSGIALCYVPDLCDGISTVSCAINLTQEIGNTTCVITLTQSFDDP